MDTGKAGCDGKRRGEGQQWRVPDPEGQSEAVLNLDVILAIPVLVNNSREKPGVGVCIREETLHRWDPIS